MLLVSLKDAAHRVQRVNRFLVWAEDEPADDVVDLKVSPALVDASIALGPEGTFAYRISTGDTHVASTAPHARSCERVLQSRLAEVGVRMTPAAVDARTRRSRHRTMGSVDGFDSPVESRLQ